MKKIILVIIMLLLVGCTNQKYNIKDQEQVKYINDNYNDIATVHVHKTTNGSNDCYNVDIKEAYDAINNIEIVKKSNISVTDDYMSYIFYFKDGTSKLVSFEGQYLRYEKENYQIKNFNQVELNTEDIVECKY